MKHKLTCSLLEAREQNNYEEADGPSPWQLPLLGSCPTQLNDMNDIELIYGITSSVPRFSLILCRRNFPTR
jgi:hypothetical protein